MPYQRDRKNIGLHKSDNKDIRRRPIMNGLDDNQDQS